MNTQPKDLTAFGEAAIYLVIGAAIICAAGATAYGAILLPWVICIPLLILGCTIAMIGMAAYGMGMMAAYLGVRAIRGKAA